MEAWQHVDDRAKLASVLETMLVTWRTYGGLWKLLEKSNYITIQMNSLAASVKLTYSASMVDRLTDFCLKVRYEIGVSSIKVMNPPIDTRSSLFVAKSESE
ncbi:hypothetical protein TNCV_271201 [Trichonephila clavipes]|nr:hypothetical protein TNCV_271201 [Trichonephila clavipes]